MSSQIQIIAVGDSLVEHLFSVPSEQYGLLRKALEQLTPQLAEFVPRPSTKAGRPKDGWYVERVDTGMMADHGIAGACKAGDGFDTLEAAGKALGYCWNALTTKLSLQKRSGGTRNYLEVKGVDLRRASTI